MTSQTLLSTMMMSGTLFGAFGCASPAESEIALPSSGAVLHGRFVAVDGGALASASNGRAEVVRARADDAAQRYDAGLAPRDELGIPFSYSDERSVVALALDADNSVAALSFELEYHGDIDEDTRSQLTLFDLDGKLRWTQELARNTSSAEYDSVAIGPSQVYVATRYGSLRAYDKDSGALAWQGRIDGSLRVKIAADPMGGVTVVAGTKLEDRDAAGATRWSTTAEALGVGELELVARAPDGSIAVLASDGELEIDSAQKLLMLEPLGGKRWSAPLGGQFSDRVSTIATDGARIVAAGDYGGTPGFDPSAPVAPDTDGFIVTVGASGARTSRIVQGIGTQRAYVTSMTPTSNLVRATSFGVDVLPSLDIDGVHADGEGVALLELAP